MMFPCTQERQHKMKLAPNSPKLLNVLDALESLRKFQNPER